MSCKRLVARLSQLPQGDKLLVATPLASSKSADVCSFLAAHLPDQHKVIDLGGVLDGEQVFDPSSGEGSVLLLVLQGVSTREEVKRSIKELKRMHLNVLGTVFLCDEALL